MSFVRQSRYIRQIECLLAVLLMVSAPPLQAQQCTAFDFEFVGTSPPIANSNAVLFLHLRDKTVRFTATDPQGDTDTGDANPAQFNCFIGGAVASCSTPGVERVTFTLARSGNTVQGDVLLAGYDRAVVDLVRTNRRIRYLLTPCACGATNQAVPVVTPPAPKAIAAPLRQATPQPALFAATPADPFFVWRILPPDVSAQRAADLAQQLFGFAGTTSEAPGSFTVSEARDPGRSLVLYKASGNIEFTDMSKYLAPGYAPTLPDSNGAIALARQFLLVHGLLPPNAETQTRVDSVGSGPGAVPNSIAVSFEARLAINAATTAPVREGTVIVWLGQGGELIRLQKNYRDVDSLPIRVSHKAMAAASAELAAKVTTLNGLTVAPAYVAFDPEIEQTYLDPVFEASDGDDNSAARVRATTFTPILSFLGPNPSLPSAASTQLLATASEGTPPYSFHWQSSLDGALGLGSSLPVRLSSGQHRIDLTVRDGNGAGISGSFLLNVAPGQAAAPLARQVVQARVSKAAVVLPSGTRINVDNGVSFVALSQETRPLVLNSVSKGGILRARNIYFDQVWYEIDVFTAGPTFYTLRSSKCMARKTSNVNACASPRLPFAQSKGTTPLMFDGSQAKVTTSATIDKLPGTLTLDFDYAGVNEFCGPEPGFFASAGLWIAEAGGLAYPLGGRCAGLRPSVKWTYQPPCDNSISGAEIQAFCAQDASACNIPAATLAGLDRTRRYFMREFRAKLATTLQPPLAGRADVSSFVKDGADETSLAATDGAINRGLQPFWAPGDGFVYIEAIAAEKSVLASNMSSRGDRDNVHIKKGVSLGVYFPGCNNPRFTGLDQLPCFHLHENWLNTTPGVNKTYSQGQRVTWYDVILRPGPEESPAGGPASITNGEVLSIVVAGLRFPLGVADQALWVESLAASRDCAPPGAFGGLDNTSRPCVVFPQGLFFTPR